MLSNTSIREYFELGFALSDEVLQEMVQETDHLICPLLGISLGVHIHKVIVQRYEYSKTAAIQKILQSTRQEYEKGLCPGLRPFSDIRMLLCVI